MVLSDGTMSHPPLSPFLYAHTRRDIPCGLERVAWAEKIALHFILIYMSEIGKNVCRASAMLVGGMLLSMVCPLQALPVSVSAWAFCLSKDEYRDIIALGDRSFSFGDYDMALKYYEYAQKLDITNPKAYCRMAMMYKSGHGVERDFRHALELYMRASECGDGKASYNVAIFYLKGDGVEKNYAEARRWLDVAAGRGNVDALYQIGRLYYLGVGVEKSYVEALGWFERAAAERYQPALVIIGDMMVKGLGCEQSPEEGIQWYVRAAESGSVEAMRCLAGCYAEGTGVEADPQEALRWYQKAADAGDAKAKEYITAQISDKPQTSPDGTAGVEKQ